MTALRTVTREHHRDWVSSFMMLCQAFTAADLSCCLFLSISAFSFVISKWMHARSVWDHEIDLAFQNNPLFFTFKISWVAFSVCFGPLSIYTMNCRPINFAAFDWIWAESISLYTSELIRLFLSSVTSSIKTQCHWKPWHHTMFHRLCCVLWIMSCSKPSPYFFSSCHSGTGWS